MFGLHYRLERKAIGLTLAIIGVAAIGGLFFLLGAIVGTYNVLMTIRLAGIERAAAGGEQDLPVAAGAVQPGE